MPTFYTARYIKKDTASQTLQFIKHTVSLMLSLEIDGPATARVILRGRITITRLAATVGQMDIRRVAPGDGNLIVASPLAIKDTGLPM